MVPTRRRVQSQVTVLLAATLTAGACGVDRDVVAIDASRTPIATPSESTDGGPPVPPTTRPAQDDVTDTTVSEPPPSTSPPPTAPPSTLPPIVEPELNADIALADVVDVDPGKPARDYDAFVAVALTDIQRWWNEQYPAVYGVPFEPLEGGVYAGYPERESDLPGCGDAISTAYDELRDFVAFYCEFGDFMIYDDDSVDVLLPLADEFGPAVMGIVLAHEFGHAIQARNGGLDQGLPTIITEQQADCFAGAWTGQAYGGESTLLRLGDRDIRAGLIAMLSVRDPVGTDQFVAGGHGSAFDRVGAFQEGFVQGPGRCAELLDEPLQLMPNAFQSFVDFERGGNASYDCTDDPSPECRPAPDFLAEDLDSFWQVALGADFAPVTTRGLDGPVVAECADAVRLADEVVVCPTERTVIFDEPAIRELYDEFGDFTIGYFYGNAWAELAQRQLGRELIGEARALDRDCLTGAWVRDITPDAQGNTPRQADADGDGEPDSTVSSSPGDLDEAIQVAILQGDDGFNVDQVGSPFEKIAAFRIGVLGGLDACEREVG